VNTESPTQLSSVSRRKVIGYGFTIFLSSAVLLVLEIVAGRLIAPYVGVSIYSWTSIIGVILAGLSLGNWLGGRWADRGASGTAVGIVLLLAAVFCIASLLLLTVVAPVVQESGLDLISASFIYVLSMFFIPAVLLGVVTPLLTTLALQLDTRTGHIVGRMHALAALGSIVGTFITGFVLVQYFGTRGVIIGSAICLLLLAIPFLRRVNPVHAVVLVVLAIGTVAGTKMRNGFANPCQWESNYFCLRVVDASNYQYGEASAMILDHLLHGINHKENPGLFVSPYVHAMDEIVRHYFNVNETSALRYFFAGGGAYTQPRAVKAMYPNARITVAELDPQVTAVAEKQMYVDTKGMNIIHQDARAVLQRDPAQYDIVVTDVFHDISVPYHMVTREFAQTVKRRLSDQGLYLINIVDLFPDARLVKSLIKTLKHEFEHVNIWLEEQEIYPSRATYVITANNSHALPDELASQRGFSRRWMNIESHLTSNGSAIQTLPVLTDDYVPVERLLSGLLLSKEGL